MNYDQYMANNLSEIAVWESVEVERSSSEAARRSDDDLRISPAIVSRYLSPAADTKYPLEYAYHLLGDATGLDVLDYGCGAGENSVLIASHGGRPIGVDISPELLELARRRMELCNQPEGDFRVGSAHDLPLDDESVDVVFGMAILHHLDLKLASNEVFRVLRKGGRAIFFEPVRNSKTVRFIRSLIPYQAPDVSPYERPLTDAELKEFARRFTGYRSRAFSLPFISLFEVLGADEMIHRATRVDGAILKAAPFLGHFAGIRVVEMTKPQ